MENPGVMQWPKREEIRIKDKTEQLQGVAGGGYDLDLTRTWNWFS